MRSGSPLTRPALSGTCHAGSSPAGRDQAAKFADVIFTAQHTTEGAKAFRTDLRRRAEGHDEPGTLEHGADRTTRRPAHDDLGVKRTSVMPVIIRSMIRMLVAGTCPPS